MRKPAENSFTPKDITHVRLCAALQDHPKQQDIRRHTMNLVKAICDREKPPKAATILNWQKQMADGLIDPNATIFKLTNSLAFESSHETGLPLWQFLLHHAQWPSGNVFDTIISRVPDFSDEQQPYSDNLERVIYCHNTGYIRTLLQHPAVNVNKLLFGKGWTLLEECFAVLQDARDRGGSKALAQGNWNKGEAEDVIRTLLEADGILHPIFTQRVLAKDTIYSPFFHYAESWQHEWEDFVQGKLAPEQLSATQLGHFYSLGHLSDALHISHWRGQEHRALELYSRLPEWVQHREPCELEMTSLIGCMSPTPNICSAHACLDGHCTAKTVGVGAQKQ